MLIIAERNGVCRACGGHVRKDEEVDYTADKGVAHVEPQCVQGPVRFRPNRRAGKCRCGTFVKAGEGSLRLVSDAGAQGGRKKWAVDCAGCAPN